MDLLVLGGTRFVGKHAVGAALARGHRVTLVHRSPTDLFPDAEHVLLDRTTGPDALAPLAGRTFDGLLDVCGYVPRVVRDSCRALAGSVGHAVFVSSVSAYAPPAAGDASDAAHAPLWPVGDLRAEGASEEITNESYGPLKVACEQEYLEAFPTASLVRPTYVIGPDDYTDRFGYWVRRMADGGEVLAADPADAPMQLIDARDLGAFMVTLLENASPGPYDARRALARLHGRRHARGLRPSRRHHRRGRHRRRPLLARRARCGRRRAPAAARRPVGGLRLRARPTAVGGGRARAAGPWRTARATPSPGTTRAVCRR